MPDSLSTRLLHDYLSITPRFTDLTIQTSLHTFQVHSAVICTLCPVLADVVASFETQAKLIDLSQYDSYVVRALINFCYKNSYILLPYQMGEDLPAMGNAWIYQLAGELQIPSLKDYALQEFKSALAIDLKTGMANCCRIANLIYTEIDERSRDVIKDIFLDTLAVDCGGFIKSSLFKDLIKRGCPELAVDLDKLLMDQNDPLPVIPTNPSARSTEIPLHDTVYSFKTDRKRTADYELVITGPSFGFGFPYSPTFDDLHAEARVKKIRFE